MQIKFPLAVLAVAVLAGCASQGGSTNTASGTAAPGGTASAKSAPATDTRVVKSRDGRFEGEMVGTAAPGSKFARLQIGMELNEVQRLIGAPNRMNTNETGKRWIPFYYGNDVTRLQTYYDGEGCLTFTGGNQFGAGGNELIRITADASGRKCAE